MKSREECFRQREQHVQSLRGNQAWCARKKRKKDKPASGYGGGREGSGGDVVTREASETRSPKTGK